MKDRLLRSTTCLGWRRLPLYYRLARFTLARHVGIARQSKRLSRWLAVGNEHRLRRSQVADERNLGIVREPFVLPDRLPAIQQDGQGADLIWHVLPPDPHPLYCISSSTLAQAHRLLTRAVPGGGPPPEWMLAVTGLRRENMRTLEQLLEIEMDMQTTARASFNMDAFTRVAIDLHKHGQALHSIFHSHRLAGPPVPSAVDWQLQDRLDEGGYMCIQAVFSEDAHVRFFARKPFTLEIYGKGVNSIDRQRHLYRIVHRGTLPDPRHATLNTERSDGL